MPRAKVGFLRFSYGTSTAFALGVHAWTKNVLMTPAPAQLRVHVSNKSITYIMAHNLTHRATANQHTASNHNGLCGGELFPKRRVLSVRSPERTEHIHYSYPLLPHLPTQPHLNSKNGPGWRRVCQNEVLFRCDGSFWIVMICSRKCPNT
jgi:hypothetical protein